MSKLVLLDALFPLASYWITVPTFATQGDSLLARCFFSHDVGKPLCPPGHTKTKRSSSSCCRKLKTYENAVESDAESYTSTNARWALNCGASRTEVGVQTLSW